MTTDIDLSVLEQFITDQKRKLQIEKELLNIESSQSRTRPASRNTANNPAAYNPSIDHQAHDYPSNRQPPNAAPSWPQSSPAAAAAGLSQALVVNKSSESEDAGFFDQMGNAHSRKNRMKEEMNREMQEFMHKQKGNKHPRLKHAQEITHSPLSNTDLKNVSTGQAKFSGNHPDHEVNNRVTALTQVQIERQSKQKQYKQELEAQIASRAQKRQKSLDEILAPNHNNQASVLAPWDREKGNARSSIKHVRSRSMEENENENIITARSKSFAYFE